MRKKLRIILAGGKTGGHLFPGIAITQALEELCPNLQVLFVGTNTPFETLTLAKYGYEHRSIWAAPIKGKKLVSKIQSVGLNMISIIWSLWIINRFKPDIVLGLGGYSSFPVIVGAWFKKVPIVLQEQNSIPGITNRILARFANCICTGFKITKKYLRITNVKYTGNPVRKVIAYQPQKEQDILFSENRFIILVTGGSQGAASINKACTEAMSLLLNDKNIFLIHQTGVLDEARIRSFYEELGIQFYVKAFFDNIVELEMKADLVVARAGAGTISEICLTGRPAILIPYPHAADNHQVFNARVIADKGGAVILNDEECNGNTLAGLIYDLKKNPAKLARMSQTIKNFAMPKAAKSIATTILQMKKG